MMYISRLVIRNFRNFAHLDIALSPGVTCIIGENNSGKTNLLHAVRLALDANLSSQYRALTEHDIHSGIDVRTANQVVIAVEFQDYRDSEEECALVGCWDVDDGTARLNYRFRPKQAILDAFDADGEVPTNLTLEDYHWELTGGGKNDPADVDWNEVLGTSIRFSDLQQFHVAFLPALRDVQQDLRQSRLSPLSRLLAVTEIPEDERNELVEILRDANEQIDGKKTIKEAGTSIQSAFADTAGEAFKMAVRLGMADPSFSTISRALTVLLSNGALKDFETGRNGLGLNNILYISMLLEYFRRRADSHKAAGQLLLIEEPEAHLHPQLQRVLYDALERRQVQTILTTHSTHISSHAPLSSLVMVTNNSGAASEARTARSDARLTEAETADLERYLDATRSTLLFARKVMLVEGPAELFLIPPLVEQLMDTNLDSLGISVVPIYGKHFEVYTKIFAENAMPKKCAVVADGDMAPEEVEAIEDELPEAADLDALKSDYVQVFQCPTTFERALTRSANLLFLAEAAEECNAPKIAKRIRSVHAEIVRDKLGKEERTERVEPLRASVLSLAKRVGKARFAQIASKHVRLAKAIPPYIEEAVNWLKSDETDQAAG